MPGAVGAEHIKIADTRQQRNAIKGMGLMRPKTFNNAFGV
jgi:hypothetical protein